MGLDQYLTRRTYVKNWDHHPEEKKHKVTVKRGRSIRKDIKPERISYVIEEIGYWRKANQIHKWFVENCQDGTDDCRDAYVAHESLKELLGICKTVWNSIELVDARVANGYTFKDGKEVPIMEDGKTIKDPSTAIELLPGVKGFFFGNTQYDQWYAKDIKHTIEILQDIPWDEDEGEYYYHSSW